jgi:DNA-directed RNA polymerase specialized sigma24 family protein
MCLLLKFSGYKYNEIAEVIGVESSSVGTILARAQAKFKEKYQKEV